MKKVRFWTTACSLIIVIINLMGQDDKNLLLFITNPLNLLGLEDMTPLLRQVLPESVFWMLQYALHLGFWLMLGVLIDWIIGRKKASIHSKKK